MKLCVTFKCPDAVEYAFTSHVNLSENEKERLKRLTEKYVQYGEYLTVEFDTEKKTARVMEV